MFKYFGSVKALRPIVQASLPRVNERLFCGVFEATGFPMVQHSSSFAIVPEGIELNAEPSSFNRVVESGRKLVRHERDSAVAQLAEEDNTIEAGRFCVQFNA